MRVSYDALVTTRDEATLEETVSRRERHRQEMRERLLAAALELFLEHGYTATTMDAIADRADVARQTLLNYFPLKEDLVRAWGQRRRDRLDHIAAEAGVGHSLREQLQRCYAALAEINEAERDLTDVLRRREHGLLNQHPVPQAVRDILERARQTGELRPGVSPQHAAEAFSALYFDAVDRWLAAAPQTTSLTKTLHAGVDLLLDGVSATDRTVREPGG